jgi:Asp-tRNA(Asn)/Glu-tRNA(Gln) amidotransferase A subunit family amidase
MALGSGLKDIYDAKGFPTAAGSLAYVQANEIRTETAPSIEKLLQLGAVMVGKTRTSKFAHGAHPWEFRDVSYSWNPRGDGHLTASASSSGSACAIAAYEWLEFTVGSDTRGSRLRWWAHMGLGPRLEVWI